MYTQTEQQKTAEKTLIKKGYRFSNWISSNGYGADNEETGCEHGTMVFCRKAKFSRSYLQVDETGNVN